MVLYNVHLSNGKSVLLGEVIDIRQVESSDRSWAGNFHFIIDYRNDDNDRVIPHLWMGPSDPHAVIVMLNNNPLEA